MVYRNEEEKLIIRAKNKDKEALKCLILNNIKYIKIEVYKITYTNSVVSYEDLVSEGIIGLIKAVDKYDLNKNIKFITYAIWWIRQAILYYINTNFWSIKVSNRTKVKLSQAEKDNLNSLFSVDDSDINGVVTSYLEDGYEQVENKIYYTELYKYIEKKLTKVELEVIKNYFGIGCKPLTLLEIGRKNSISGERVRQIKKKAIDKIKQNMEVTSR